jgi:putative FmdB family regulatory protein
MRYPYRCSDCSFEFDVVKSLKDIDQVEHCEKCGAVANRFIARTHFYGARVEDAEFNPGLGCVVKNRKHRESIARDRGLVEVGNEDCEKTFQRFEQDRERRIEKSWDEV